MLYDVTWLQKVIIKLAILVGFTCSLCFICYGCGKKDQQLEYQREALLVAEQATQNAIIVQQEMEKTDAQLEKASSVSDECNFVLNFDLTPCGVFK